MVTCVNEGKRFIKMYPLDLATWRLLVTLTEEAISFDLSGQKSYCNGLVRALVLRK